MRPTCVAIPPVRESGAARTSGPRYKPGRLLRGTDSQDLPKALGFVPVEFSAGDEVAHLNRRRARDRENTHGESQNQEWEQTNSFARSIQPSRRGDLEKGRKIADGRISRQRKQGDDSMERRHSLVEHPQ